MSDKIRASQVYASRRDVKTTQSTRQLSNISNIRSPLRYVGGKTRGMLEISRFIPQGTSAIMSPFFGGGSLEILCASNGLTVYGFDNFKPLVEFWQCLLNNPKYLTKLVKRYHPLSKSKFYNLQRTQHNHTSKYERAAIYFVLNRSSFSGTTLSGGMSPQHPRFTLSSIERLANFKIKNLKVKQLDFATSILQFPKTLLYLDPPYMLNQCLYGIKGNMHQHFDHKKLAKSLHKRNKWILSYNDCSEVHKLYDGYEFHYPKWSYGMSNNKKSCEVIILSHDLEVKCPHK